MLPAYAQMNTLLGASSGRLRGVSGQSHEKTVNGCRQKTNRTRPDYKENICQGGVLEMTKVFQPAYQSSHCGTVWRSLVS